MKTVRTLVAVALAALLLAGAGAPATAEGSADGARAPRVPGMVIVESDRSFDDTWDALVAAIDANPNIRRVATIDHAAAAASVGLDLAPNRVVVFGNPALGSPLMLVNQTAGLDLPQKIQVFEDDGTVWVGFNDAAWLAARHRLGELPQLDTIAGALRNLTGAATGTDVDARSFGNRSFLRHPGLLTAASDADVDTTWNRLLAAIDASPASVVYQVDHQAGAASVDLDLRPTRLVVFGNPNLGTPAMQERPTAGIDLPLRFLVWEDADGQVYVTTNDDRLVRRHRIRTTDITPASNAVVNFLRIATTGS